MVHGVCHSRNDPRTRHNWQSASAKNITDAKADAKADSKAIPEEMATLLPAKELTATLLLLLCCRHQPS